MDPPCAHGARVPSPANMGALPVDPLLPLRKETSSREAAMAELEQHRQIASSTQSDPPKECSCACTYRWVLGSRA
jgi:hypothetical protein